MKICLISLGCPKNLVDAEMMLGFLKKDGFGFTLKPEEGDVIVVNTCGFLEASSRESIDKILEMARYKEEGRCRLLIATGCLTQRHGEALSKEMPEVDLFVGTGEFDKISKMVGQRFGRGVRLWRTPLQRTLVSNHQILPDPDLPRVLATPKHYAYVKIAEGCSHICSFCTIPSIRGGLKSRTIESVLQEVEQLVAQGVKEFNLIAQDLNEFGRDLKNGSNLAALLTELNKVQGDFWLRPLYMYPLEFNDKLIGVLRDSEHVVKYVDMPLQHINERILLSMKRGSPSRYVRQVLTKLKTQIPDIAIRTTFIVGYPGETEAEFQELYDFVKEYEFERVGVFKFSQEDGTPSATLPDQVSDEVKEDRYHRLMTLQRDVSLKVNQKLVGKTVRVLVEGQTQGLPPRTQARLASQAPEIDGVTFITKGKIKPGDFMNVKITGAEDYDLIATV